MEAPVLMVHHMAALPPTPRHQHMAAMHHHMALPMEHPMQLQPTLATLQQHPHMLQVATALLLVTEVLMEGQQGTQQHRQQQQAVTHSLQAVTAPAPLRQQQVPMASSSTGLILVLLQVAMLSRLLHLLVPLLVAVSGRPCQMIRAAPTTITHRQVSASGRSPQRWLELAAIQRQCPG